MRRKQLLGQTQAALAKLSDAQQAVIRMRDQEMMSYEEIARRMGLPSAGTARALRCHALVRLLHAIEVEGME